jgi:hypothetical protein
MSTDGLPEIVEMTPGESEWSLWMMSSDVDTGGKCGCGHEGLGPSWHHFDCRGANYALANKLRELFIQIYD